MIRLKHQYKDTVPLRTFYFYDGRTVVRNGVIEIPADKPSWLDRAFMVGYRLDPETGKPLELAAIRARAAAPATKSESTKSAGASVEGSSSRR